MAELARKAAEREHKKGAQSRKMTAEEKKKQEIAQRNKERFAVIFNEAAASIAIISDAPTAAGGALPFSLPLLSSPSPLLPH